MHSAHSVGRPLQIRLGVTGTDTGVGKTVVACALLARARQLGISTAAMKPVETGVTPGLTAPGLTAMRGSTDAERLRFASGDTDSLKLIRPYALAEPLAPMVAAQRAGVEIDLHVLDAACEALGASRQLFLVEGAGGLLVPISPSLSFADVFRRWKCELIVVAANRLGVLNHVLLTVRAAEAAEVPVRAVVLTQLTERDTDVAMSTNYDALVTLLPRHRVFRFPWMEQPDDLNALSAAAAASGLDVLIAASLMASSMDAYSLPA